MEARGVVAKPPSGLATGPPTMGAPTCVREDLQGGWGVDLLVLFSGQVADLSEDSTNPQQPVHMSSEGLKTSTN